MRTARGWWRHVLTTGILVITADERNELETSLEAVLGPGNKRTLMTMLQPAEGADIATSGDVEAVRVELRRDFTELWGEFEVLRGEFEVLRGEFADLRGEFDVLRREFVDLRGDVAALRNEFVEFRTEMKVGDADLRSEIYNAMRQQTLALVATMVTISGLTFAATALLG